MRNHSANQDLSWRKNEPLRAHRAKPLFDIPAPCSYSQDMRSGRIISMLIAAVVLLLRAGDCVPLLFADQQAKDCCHRGKCSPAKNADSCCKTSSSAPVQHFQAQEKFSYPPLVQSDLLIATDSTGGFGPFLTAAPFLIEISPHASPGPIARISLPLLI
jgi:hypothetical protein